MSSLTFDELNNFGITFDDVGDGNKQGNRKY